MLLSVASTRICASAERARARISRAKCSGMITAARDATAAPASPPATSPAAGVTTRNVSEVRNASAYWRDSGVWSRSWMTIGMSVTVSEIAVPSSDE